MENKHGMPFGSQGPEGKDGIGGKEGMIGGAKGGGMKHVVTPGSNTGATMDPQEEAKKHMIMMALMRAAAQGQGGSQPMGGGQPMGGAPMPGGPGGPM